MIIITRMYPQNLGGGQTSGKLLTPTRKIGGSNLRNEGVRANRNGGVRGSGFYSGEAPGAGATNSINPQGPGIA